MFEHNIPSTEDEIVGQTQHRMAMRPQLAVTAGIVFRPPLV